MFGVTGMKPRLKRSAAQLNAYALPLHRRRLRARLMPPQPDLPDFRFDVRDLGVELPNMAPPVRSVDVRAVDVELPIMASTSTVAVRTPGPSRLNVWRTRYPLCSDMVWQMVELAHAPSTRERYDRAFLTWAKWAAGRGFDVCRPTNMSLAMFLVSECKDQSPSAWQGFKSALGSVCPEFAKDKLLTDLLAGHERSSLVTGVRHVECPNISKVFELLKSWPANSLLSDKLLRTKCCFLLACAGIIRVGDLNKLLREDVCFRSDCVVLRIVFPKGARLKNAATLVRIVYLPSLLGHACCPVDCLRMWLERHKELVSGPVFVSVPKDPAISPGPVEPQTLCSCITRDLYVKAGVAEGLSAHAFKSFMVSKVWAAGVSEDDIALHSHAFSVSVLRKFYLREIGSDVQIPSMAVVDLPATEDDHLRLARSFLRVIVTAAGT